MEHKKQTYNNKVFVIMKYNSDFGFSVYGVYDEYEDANNLAKELYCVATDYWVEGPFKVVTKNMDAKT